MRMQVQSLASLSRLRSHCPELWCRPAATVPIGPLVWDPPYAADAALKRPKKKKNVEIGDDKIYFPGSSNHKTIYVSTLIICSVFALINNAVVTLFEPLAFFSFWIIHLAVFFKTKLLDQ